ncbi:asparagine synthase (glutamine-hydrolyzing) [Cytophagales bacterium LB-30]|uniref:asparagine synthase (glutamine-hydrolyzing) n=1 Tax=Shiella aurantiaca TaxID=3058365 RepID=A0ABT8F948_9BACT|nr:asparagine synthase (glutamine-hydrolyzing) [Shiella aurantiaca]MDN4166721.1 asparagine synthase (glutamine-hydrolyzing) [Shiella aurantiaca]
MCGLNALLCDDSLGRAAIEKMNAATTHRGPDSSAYISIPWHKQQSLFLGFNRLKIVDVHERANQPFQSSDKRFALLFNGQLYNYIALKNQLLTKGVSFSTASDTEVVLHWLSLYGEKGLADFQGMFALVFVDAQEKTFFTARDAQGMKPLYYAQSDEALLISSECRGIFASGLISKRFNHEAIPYYLAYKAAPAPATFFQDVWELPPQNIGRFPENRAAEISSYTLKKSEHVERISLREGLQEALFNHLQGEVNGGIFLSGGIDSTLLLALLQDLGISLPAFSIQFTDSPSPDSEYAQKAAKQYGAAWFPTPVDASLWDDFEAFVHSVDQPIADSAAWLTQLLAQSARKRGITFALSGAGADELFAGYNRHAAFWQALNHPQLMQILKAGQGALLPLLGLFSSERKRHAQQFLRALSPSAQETFLRFCAMQAELPAFEKKELRNPEEAIRWALQHDQRHYLVEDVLALSDRMSMWQALELRLPFLDKTVVEIAQQYTAQELLAKGRKTPLRELLIQMDGKPYVQRSKMGFGMPLSQFFHSQAALALFEASFPAGHPLHAYIPSSTYQALIAAHRAGKRDYAAEIYSYLLLFRWFSVNFID